MTSNVGNCVLYSRPNQTFVSDAVTKARQRGQSTHEDGRNCCSTLDRWATVPTLFRDFACGLTTDMAVSDPIIADPLQIRLLGETYIIREFSWHTAGRGTLFFSAGHCFMLTAMIAGRTP